MKHQENGFTLVEVLVALVVLTIAFSALMVALNENARNVGFLENETAANWVATNVLAQAQLGLLNLNRQTSKDSGQQSMLGKTYSWELTVGTTDNRWVNEMEVSVSSEDGKQIVLEMTGYKRGANEQ